MTTHVVGSMDNLKWGQVEHWWKSLICTGFDGEIHMLVRNCAESALKQLRDLDIRLHEVKRSKFQIVVERFSALKELCETLESDEWVVACDTTDIVFQRDPTEFLENISTDYSLVVASETIAFEHNDWTRKNLDQHFPELWENLRGKVLYNAGSIAGLAGDLAELAEDICRICYTKPNAKNHDQAVMNALLHRNPFKTKTLFTRALDGWCYCCASTVFAKDHEKPHLQESLAEIRNGRCYMPNGELAYLFHHYDRGVSLKRAVEWVVQKDWERFCEDNEVFEFERIPVGLPYFKSIDELRTVPQPQDPTPDSVSYQSLESRVSQLETLVEQLMATHPPYARKLRL